MIVKLETSRRFVSSSSSYRVTGGAARCWYCWTMLGAETYSHTHITFVSLSHNRCLAGRTAVIQRSKLSISTIVASIIQLSVDVSLDEWIG